MAAGTQFAFPVQDPTQQDLGSATPEAGGEHQRLETEHGPVHLWRPAAYDPRTAGIVIYIHGYYKSVDQAWADDRLGNQFSDSGRNALFIAIEAPQSNNQDVAWKSLGDLLHTVGERAPFPLPRGPLVAVVHSGGYRTILMWLGDPRLQCLILLDSLYGGLAEFQSWLRVAPRAKPHRIVLVASDTTVPQSNRLARRVYSTTRRRSIPVESSSFTPREVHSRLLYLRSQYDHQEMINNGKVIPVLLEITPIKGLAKNSLQISGDR